MQQLDNSVMIVSLLLAMRHHAIERNLKKCLFDLEYILSLLFDLDVVTFCSEEVHSNKK